MALETLKGLEEINGVGIGKGKFIEVDHDEATIK